MTLEELVRKYPLLSAIEQQLLSIQVAARGAVLRYREKQDG